MYMSLSHLLVVDVAVLTLAATVADPARGAMRGGRRRGSGGGGARGDDDAAGRGADGVGQVLKLEMENIKVLYIKFQVFKRSKVLKRYTNNNVSKR